jgi:FkbM family methyltransferase
MPDTGQTDLTDKRDILIARVKGLYSRLHHGQLGLSDTVDISEISIPSTEDYVEKIHADRAEFDRSLGGFAEAYDIFRIFGDDVSVLDVGAHWGYSAVAMRHQGCRAKIISIEAMPFNMPALERLKAIENGGYDCINMAAGTELEELTFHVPTMNGFAGTGLASTGATLDDYFAFLVADLAQVYPPSEPGGTDDVRLAILKVPSAPIDWILKNRVGDGRPVAAVKMDVEGHEAPALTGAGELFRRQKPLLMLENANRDPACVKVMLDHGYFHSEREGGRLRAQTEFSYANDGFWVSRDLVETYRNDGIFVGTVPSVTEAARAVEAKWNAKTGFA